MNSPSGLLLVTGASGFLGSKVVDLAREAGWQVRALSRRHRVQKDGVETILGDVGDIALLRKACDGVTVIVHAAGLAHVFGPDAKDATRFEAVNGTGTANVVDAALECGVSHIVLVSSVAVYGSNFGATCDEATPCHPEGPYAMSKRNAEINATERMAKGRSSLTILRFVTIYGEGDRGNVAKLIDALDRRRFVWAGSGQNQKSLIYVEDAARACLHALQRKGCGTEVFNVSAQPSTMRDIVSVICQSIGRQIPRATIPPPLLSLAALIARCLGDPGNLNQRLQKFVRNDVYDGTRFEATYNFRTTVSLSEGIRREVDFNRIRGAL